MAEMQGILQDVHDPVARALRVVFHDALYAFAPDTVGGTLVDEAAQDVGFPRRGLAADVVSRIKGVFPIPVGWNTVAFRFGWSPTVATNNFKFGLEYALYYPFAGQNVDTLAVTTISIPSIVEATGANIFRYQVPTETAAIATADGAFGSKPFMVWSLERDGVTDTNTGLAEIEGCTLSRIN